jgi:hypothetical protein
MPVRRRVPILFGALALVGCGASMRAAEHVTLRNGFSLDCTRHEADGDRIRLYLLPRSGEPDDGTNYLEVPASSVASTEPIPELPASNACSARGAKTAGTSSSPGCHPEVEHARGDTPPFLHATAQPTASEIRQMLTGAGSEHDIDADLLAAVVHAESGGQARAVSRSGAEGLMQLMPGTASALGVRDAFAPEQNITGGTSYLDHLLTRYHDNLALALAAYNAGPAAVDRYHGIPPYTETRLYVARVIREFNRRKLAAAHSPQVLAAGTPPIGNR